MLACLVVGSEALAGEKDLLSVFPESTFHAADPGTATASFDFAASPGPWAEGMDERDVFQVSLKHSQDPLNSYELRVGKGGQIYSLQGAFGESVPPSWRSGNNRSPWNDEVWQFVAVCSRYNYARKGADWIKAAAPYKTSYFIHNSGCYMPESAVPLRNLYCPLLASGYDAPTRTYRQVNWGLVPQHQTIHRSPLLYYLQVRDAGGGVIELTWVVHNFSVRDDIVFDHLNAPWGGTRVSSLPLHAVARPDGSLETGNSTKAVDVRQTGGFDLASATSADDSPSLALVFGRDKNLDAEKARAQSGVEPTQFKPSLYRSIRAAAPLYTKAWQDWQTRPANSFRNYQVAVVIPKLRLAPDTTIWYRSYLVVDGRDKAAARARELVDQVDYGSLDFPPASTPIVPVKSDDGKPLFGLFVRPVKGSLPVFRLKDRQTGRVAYTTDPYLFTPQEKLALAVPKEDADYDYFSQAVGYTLDGKTEYQGLAGFACKERPAEGDWQKLSIAVGSEHFSDPTPFHVDVWVARAD